METSTNTTLAERIKQWGLELGFQQVGITDTNLSDAEQHLQHWLAKDFHGEMDYMHRHGLKRSRPALLHEGTISVISVRMDYLPEPATTMDNTLADPTAAYISCYALGRDYHKILRKRLQTLADKIQAEIGDFGYRAFVDSAPVLEKALAEKAGLGWIGKHSNVINRKAGSWFFLGDLHRFAFTRRYASHRTLRWLHGLSGYLPYASHCCTVSSGCAALRIVSDHRIARCYSGGI
jgi:epoxyqueuosine reductase